jgi:plasmid stabilization system protein ParE
MTEAALAALGAIGRYIGRDSPERAESFVEQIHRKCAARNDATCLPAAAAA